jgi:hypothetical protein
MPVFIGYTLNILLVKKGDLLWQTDMMTENVVGDVIRMKKGITVKVVGAGLTKRTGAVPASEKEVSKTDRKTHMIKKPVGDEAGLMGVRIGEIITVGKVPEGSATKKIGVSVISAANSVCAVNMAGKSGKIETAISTANSACAVARIGMRETLIEITKAAG